MAHVFSDKVIDTLRGKNDNPIYHFLEIITIDKSFLFTTFDGEVTDAEVPAQHLDSVSGSYWLSSYITGVSAPARTGDITQEVQRFEFKQALDFAFNNAGDDLISSLGYFHNARTICSAYIHDGANWVIDPISRTYGLVKKLNATEREGLVVLETTSTFGKLQTVKEMVTTPDSLNKYIEFIDIQTMGKDSSFNNAGSKHDRSALEWGT